MDLTLTNEQELIASTAREVLAAKSPPAHVRAMRDDPTGYSSDLWKEMVELGWMGLAIPETYGGVGMGLLELCLVVEQMGAHQTPSPFVPTVVLAAEPIARFATEEQKQAYLPNIAAGEKIMTYGASGPGGGWDPADTGVVAKRDGDGFVLSGRLLFVPWAHVADDLLVVARREGSAEDALMVFVVPSGGQGTGISPLESVHGDRQHAVELTDVRVPSDAVLGEADAGRSVVEAIGELGAAAACAQMVGGAQRVLDMTVSYATDRKQFGSPIGSFQAIQHHCANMAMDVLGSRFITYEAIWRLDEGLEAGEEISMAKAWTSEAYRRVCGLAHQVHGAIGFTEEFDLHFYFRHAVSSELAFGDGSHHLELVARRLGL